MNETREHGMPRGAGHAVRVLCVDDAPEIRQVVQLVLEQLGGFDVHLAGSGEEALLRLPAILPNLVLLDQYMPGIDGRETLRQLRQSEAGRDVPVIFLSAAAETGLMGGDPLNGVLGWIEKPFDPLALPERVMKLWNEQ